MREVSVGSEAFTRAVRSGSQRGTFYAEVLLGPDVVATNLAVTRGSIDEDRSQAVMATAEVGLIEPTLLPTTWDSPLSPWGFQIRIWRGVSVNGSDINVPLGTFPIQDSDVQGGQLSTQLSCLDRFSLIAQARFEDSYRIENGTSVTSAIRELIIDGVPDQAVDLPSTTFTTPRIDYLPQDDRLAAARSLATGAGLELYLDGLGVVRARQEPTFSDEPALTTEDGERGTLIDLSFTATRARVYNRVVATGANALSVGVTRGVATDDDPNSPTYYGGPFGKAPLFFASPLLTSDAHCASAAATRLASQLGRGGIVSATRVPDPRVELTDVHRLKDSALSLDEVGIVERLSTPLTTEEPQVIDYRTQLQVLGTTG